MTSFTGRFYDGEGSTPQQVRVDASPGGLRLSGADGRTLRDWTWGEVFVVSKPGGGMRATLGHEGDAARLAVPDAAWAPCVSPYIKEMHDGPGAGSFRFAAIVAACCVALIVALPYIMDDLALYVPEAWQDTVGEQTVASITREAPACHAHRLADTALSRLTKQLDADGRGMKLHIVASGEVNALTTTGHNLIVFAGLLRTASSQAELAGVLAHEIGHAHYHHAIRGLVRDQGMALLINGFAGGNGASLGAANTLLSLKGTRKFEAQADAYSLQAMTRNGYDPHGLIAFLTRMENLQKMEKYVPEWAMSHPGTAHRVATLTKAAAELPPHPAPYKLPFSKAEWREIKHYCDDDMPHVPKPPEKQRRPAPQAPYKNHEAPQWQRRDTSRDQPI
ncbi:MAG: M48 family metalloprotease [Alphaproteobacteria bacterium]|nr:M48 family metalloprotease [Alphaproteobacteria bacterium]